ERDEKLAVRWANQLQDAVSDTELELTAQLATLRVSAVDLASIQAGDTIWFKPPEAVKVLVQSTHLFDAEYGTANNSVAVRITEVIQPVESSASFAIEPIGEQVNDSESSSSSRRRSAGRSAKSAGASAA
ncbi:MAG: FliM/FliN family flagellar motor switch protein, partial [Steroidobacteraceae bacterium]